MTSRTLEISLTIPQEQAGQRLDLALAALLPDYSRSRLKAWIESGEVRVDGATLRPRDKVFGGESVSVRAVLPVESRAAPQDIPLLLVHEDRHVFVVDKPAGLVVHPGAGNPDRTLQNALLALDPGLAGLPRAGIVHRLDKETSGLLIVARTLPAHTALVRMIGDRDVHREYQAICRGVMTAGGTVDAPIDRHPTDRVRMAVRQGGREAVTHYRVIKRFRSHTHVRVQLETGRTHRCARRCATSHARRCTRRACSSTIRSRVGRWSARAPCRPTCSACSRCSRLRTVQHDRDGPRLGRPGLARDGASPRAGRSACCRRCVPAG